MTQKHTPEPWAQGVLLETNTTKRYTPELWEKRSHEEKCRIFANFHQFDEGRSRTYIAVCERAEDAARIVACVNAMAGIEDPADWMKETNLLRMKAQAVLEQGKDNALAGQAEMESCHNEILQLRAERKRIEELYHAQHAKYKKLFLERDQLKEEVLFHRAHDMTAKWEQLDKLRNERDFNFQQWQEVSELATQFKKQRDTITKVVAKLMNDIGSEYPTLKTTTDQILSNVTWLQPGEQKPEHSDELPY